ncbi:MAG: hypothetical protein GY906_27015 [bacterium]|nr:hypothetical protein [bacterium]
MTRRWLRHPLNRRAWEVLAVAVLAGCVSTPYPQATLQELRWPRDDPRVAFERVVQTRADISRGGILSWIRGDRKERLFDRPYGIAWDGDSLVVADPGAGMVLRLSSSGRVRTSLEGLLESPIGVAVCLGEIFVSDARAGNVAVLDQRLRFTRWQARGLDRPTGIVCGDEGQVFVVETGSHSIVLLQNSGVEWRFGSRGSGLGEFNFPTALTLANGSLWIADVLNFRLQRLRIENREIKFAFGRLGDTAGEMPRIKDVGIDASGSIWVTDAHLDRVSLYTQTGDLLMSLGGSGSALGDFSFPAGIATHADGRVAVVDSLNRRIQVFRLIDHEGERNE